MGQPHDPRGNLVRPYAVTRGRTEPQRHIPIEAVLVASQAAVQEARFAGHDKYRIAVLCEPRAQSLAEIAAYSRLALGVARVLVADVDGAAAGRVEGGRAGAAVGRVCGPHKTLSSPPYGSPAQTCRQASPTRTWTISAPCWRSPRSGRGCSTTTARSAPGRPLGRCILRVHQVCPPTAQRQPQRSVVSVDALGPGLPDEDARAEGAHRRW